jgi:hypothetical protein
VTLLYIDGFAHQNTNRYLAGSTVSGGYFSNGISFGAPQPYYAGSPAITRPLTASAEVYTGIRAKWQTLTSGRAILVLLGDAQATTHLTLQLNSSSQLELRRGTPAGTILATGTTVFTSGVFNYIEMHATIADSGGVCQVRINGSATNEIDFTGDTKNAGTSTNIDGVKVGDGSGQLVVTDWYIANALGSSPTNSWLGDTVVRTLAPSGDGDLSQLVGSDGNQVSNWQQVDELPPATADYNGSPTVGNEDTYALADLPSTTGVSVYGVQVCAVMAKSDAGAANGQPVLRVSSTDYTATARVLSTTYAEAVDFYEKNPATGTFFTASEVNAAQAGMKVA